MNNPLWSLCMNKEKLEALLAWLDAGKALVAGTEMYELMHACSDEALRIQSVLNSVWHSPAEIRLLMSELTGRNVPESFKLFPPFYSDFGKNIHLGENVFINSCCCFQDQGGIYIGDNCLIGHRATIATINHAFNPRQRHIHNLAPVHIEADVWLGSNVTIVPGVRIGRGSIVGAGSVVIKNVEPMSIVAGNPARKIKDVPADQGGIPDSH